MQEWQQIIKNRRKDQDGKKLGPESRRPGTIRARRPGGHWCLADPLSGILTLSGHKTGKTLDRPAHRFYVLLPLLFTAKKMAATTIARVASTPE